MNFHPLSRLPRSHAGLEGVLLALTPAPFLLLSKTTDSAMLPPAIASFAAASASLACLAAALLLPNKPLAGKFVGFLGIAACAVAALPALATSPSMALLGAVALIQSGYFLSELKPEIEAPRTKRSRIRRLQRARNAHWVMPALVLASLLLPPESQAVGAVVLAVSTLIGQALLLHWLWTSPRGAKRWLWGALPLAAAGLTVAAWRFGFAQPVAGCISLAMLTFLPRAHTGREQHEHWWEPFLNHPARVLISTFSGLCLIGALLLNLPWATTHRTIDFVDAAFTSVSAVCVTGLIVLDTPKDFTFLGQGIILLLIQLGGLGIMTITTVALHVMGRRLSLRQERLLTTMTETSHLDLIGSLFTIVRFTLLAELAGAVVLTACFLGTGIPLPLALWQGVFTAISAFCNAGFALYSTNLLAFQTQPFVLHTVAILIVLGGLAPATCLIVPDWLRGRKIELAPRIAVVTTAVLLLFGTFCFLIFEWDNALAGLSFFDKLHNAWFQSVTLRTAGFNSIDINGVLSPTYLVMLGSMFIGGSPGGTAGGIKTTTIGILAMTFWASITDRNAVIAQNRRIPPNTINRAITVFASGVMVWFTMVLALSLTQQLPARELIFEVTSALGTVGLSLGATPFLDEIGKIVVILTMFIGRIGPMTLFTLLSGDIQATDSRCPEARITLT